MATEVRGMLIEKDFSVFDCDAHVNEPHTIWSDYVEPEYKDIVQAAFWKDEDFAYLNGRTPVASGTRADLVGRITYNPATIAGPGMGDKRLLRRLQQMRLTEAQADYLDHKGAWDGAARVPDMDLMGIDQVLVIPTKIINHFVYVENVNGAYGLARAYNNWVADYCKPSPGRLFGAGILPLQYMAYAVKEIRRMKDMGFPVALMRPIDAKNLYPNRIYQGASDSYRNRGLTMDSVFRTLEETGVVCGMHTLPHTSVTGSMETKATMDTPCQLLHRVTEKDGVRVDQQTMGFIWEGSAWLIQVLLSGFFDIYPNIKMAIFETNAAWVLQVLESCDRAFKLYRNERRVPAKRLPSEAFRDQCVIGFEADETPVFRLWEQFQDIAIWASDAYHHDGAPAWDALHLMAKHKVPREAMVKLMGGNARRMYGIEPKLFVRHEREIQRPDWFPKKDAAFEQWWKQEAHPKKQAAARGG